MYISTKYSVNGKYREGQVAYVHCAIGSFYQDQSVIWNLFLGLKLAGIKSKLTHKKKLKFKKKSESGSNLNFGSRGKISYNEAKPLHFPPYFRSSIEKCVFFPPTFRQCASFSTPPPPVFPMKQAASWLTLSGRPCLQPADVFATEGLGLQIE